MADPLSFVASVIAIAGLAEAVATRGYRYLKAVKNCPDEVRNLMAETNVLCGILGRLSVLVGGNRLKSEATAKSKEPASQNSDDDDDESSDEEDVTSDGNDVSKVSHRALHPPDFIYECQKTLQEIDKVLQKFQHTKISNSRCKITQFRRMEAKDLKWPLRKSETMQLIEALERHKNTCTLALAGNGLAGIHMVLEQTKFTNKILANLMAKQEKLFELNITHEQEKVLAWLSPVNPASKLQVFRRERQPGTGRWLFDLPEVSGWLEHSNSALWIYGIPGAGKTILSTLVVDEILTRKRSSSIGTAYFYIRHDDRTSQSFSNVLGSLISQLARQNSAALDEVVELHEQHRREGSLTTSLDDDDLFSLLFYISKYFIDTFIMVDGLDECGSPFDRDRKRLIDALAGIHHNPSYQIHTLVFSRDELDIRQRLTATEFQIVSIAARSADLRLYVNAWLPEMDIQSESLKVEIADTLVEEANGMFMWVRAQVDYLQRLPTDKEKRKALKGLPPDLPRTYVRILEMIDSTYPIHTTKFIQRLLKWLVLNKSFTPFIFTIHDNLTMTSRMLCQAICIENESERIPDSEMPTEQQILGWLGCLVRRSTSTGLIELSHFTIKEFLSMASEEVSSVVACKYLVKREDYNYLVKVCLLYLMHDDFQSMTCSNVRETRSLARSFPLHDYATWYLCDYVWELSTSSIRISEEVQCIMQRFLSIPVHAAFRLWGSNVANFSGNAWEDCSEGIIETNTENFWSPLHFATLVGLSDETQRLLKNGLDPNSTSFQTEMTPLGYTPLHLTLINYSAGSSVFLNKTIINYIEPNLSEPQPEHRLQMIRTLVKAGADVNQQLGVICEPPINVIITTPFILALMAGFWRGACILLDSGADWEAIACEKLPNTKDVCSIERLLEIEPECEELVQRVVDFCEHQELKGALEHWRDGLGSSSEENDGSEGSEGSDGQCIGESDGHSMKNTKDIEHSASGQERFIDAYQNGNWAAVRQLLQAESGTTGIKIEINCNDDQGNNALYWLADGSSDDLSHLLQCGANPNFLTTSGRSALSRAVRKACLENMSLLLEFGANIEHQDPGGWTALLCAILHCSHAMVQRLLDEGANPHAMLDDGRAGIDLAIENADTEMFSLLLKRGLNPTVIDNYGSAPLHLACDKGLHLEVVKLIETIPNSINEHSLIHGTPLYVAAEQGFVSIVRKLLDAGAAIDDTGPGNLLGSALMVACARGACEVVELLLARGASCEAEGSRFLSAIGTARAFRQTKIITILEKHSKTVKETQKA